MIFYHPDCDLRFSNYGIEIPIKDDRAEKVFNALKVHDPSLQFVTSQNTISQKDLESVHTLEYLNNIFGNEQSLKQAVEVCYELINSDGSFNRYNPENSKSNFYHLRETILLQMAIFLESTNSALDKGFSFFLGGGMHHAMSFGGRGFCLFNDVVFVIKKLQQEKKIKHAWVIDLDAHKGDGTAELTKNDSNISTFSIHMKNGWPLNQGNLQDPWFIKSDLDIEIDLGEENIYLEKLDLGLKDFAKKFPQPDLVIVVDGADPSIDDELPSSALLKLSKEQMLERDKLVFNFLKDRNIPMSYCMAGGYGKNSWEIYYQFLHFVGQYSSKGTEISSR
jgi:acetoin utilization deacetylase AcuC-like enzyme